MSGRLAVAVALAGTGLLLAWGLSGDADDSDPAAVAGVVDAHAAAPDPSVPDSLETGSHDHAPSVAEPSDADAIAEPGASAGPTGMAAVERAEAPVADTLRSPVYVVHGRVTRKGVGALRKVGFPDETTSGVSVVTADGVHRQVWAEDDGAFALSGLEPGVFDVRASARGFREARMRVELDPEHPVARCDFTLEADGLLAIEAVTPEGDPLPAVLEGFAQRIGLVVVASEGPLGDRVGELTRNDSRRFGLGTYHSLGHGERGSDPAQLGSLQLERPLPLQVTLANFDAALASQWVDAGTERVRFVVDPAALEATRASVTGRFELPEELDAARAGILLYWANTGTHRALDDDGAFRFEDLPPGPCRLGLGLPGYAAREQRFRLQPGQDLDLGTIPVVPARRLSGRVLEADGRPVRVRLEFVDGDPEPNRVANGDWQHLTTEADGTFEIVGLFPGPLDLRVVPRADVRRGGTSTGALPLTTVDLARGDVEGLTLELRAARTLIVERDAAGQARTVEVLDAAGNRVRTGRFVSRFEPLAFALGSGAYRVQALDGFGEVLSRHDVELEADVQHVRLEP